MPSERSTRANGPGGSPHPGSLSTSLRESTGSACACRNRPCGCEASRGVVEVGQCKISGGPLSRSVGAPFAELVELSGDGTVTDEKSASHNQASLTAGFVPTIL